MKMDTELNNQPWNKYYSDMFDSSSESDGEEYYTLEEETIDLRIPSREI